MKIIQLKSCVQWVGTFTNGWAFDLKIKDENKQYCIIENKQYCIIDKNQNVSYRHGCLFKGFFDEEDSIKINTYTGRLLGYLNQHGQIIAVPERVFVDNDPNYQYSFIEKDSIFDGMFQIEKNKIGIAINKPGSNYVVSQIPNVFSSFKNKEYNQLFFKISKEKDNILIFQLNCDKIVIMDNPLNY